MMKNLLIAVLSVFISLPVLAQLSGTYTIGGTSPNYTTVKEAVDSLNKKGVNGAVTYHIRSGNYNAQFTINNVSGASATNNITFKPDPANTGAVTIQYNASTSSDNYVIQFKSAKYITFDSLNIGNVTTGSYATVISFTDTCDHIKFSNNTIQGSQSSITSLGTTVIHDERGTGQDAQNITFENNNIKNGSYAFYIYGASSIVSRQQDKWIIKNNNIEGWGYYGIYSWYNKNIEIVNNKITSSNSVYFFGQAVYLYFNSTCTVKGNTIFNAANGYGVGLYMQNCYGVQLNPNDISNNIIRCNGARYGMYVSGSNYSNIYFNTVKIDGGSSTSSPAAYLNLNSSSNFKNNILYNSRNTGIMTSLGTSLQPDYNNYYSPVQSATIVGANSLSVDPMFNSATDLHINNVQLNGKAQFITGITTDVDGDTRNNPTDIGADEFDPDTLDASVLDLREVYCIGNSNMEVTILNFGLDTIKTMKIRYGLSVNGRPFQYQNYSYSGSLASGNTAVVNLQNYNFLADTTYRITVRIDSLNGKPDTVLTNNSKTTITFSTAISGTFTIGGASPDFVDFRAAVSKLNSSGICGPTTFKVRQGLYNQNVVFAKIKGVSLSDTIVFEADTGVTSKPILYSNQASTIAFNDNQGITFRNIAIHNNNTNGSVMMFNRSNRLIRIDSCELRADTANRPGFNSRVIMNNRSNPLSNLIVSNSDLRGGYYSVFLNGTSTQDFDSSATFINNKIHDWYYYGIYSWYQTGAKFIGNTLDDKNIAGGKYGLYAYYNYDSEFSKNSVLLSHVTSGYGMYLYYFAGSSTAVRGKFNNNFISSYYANTSLQDLVYFNRVRNSDYYFNSFYLKSNNQVSNAVEMYFPSNVNFRDNIIHADAPGIAYNRSGTFVSTHNNIYAPGGTPSNLPLGASDVSINPFYKSKEDLHVKSIFLDNKGIRIAGVSTDIDNEVRATVPDIGADEFNVDTNDIGVVSVVAPTTGVCGLDSQKVKVLILNNGRNSQSNFPITVQVRGAVTANLTGTYSGTIASAKYDTVEVGIINTKAGGKLSFKAWSGLATDSYRENDTLVPDDISIDRIPTVPTIASPIIVCDGIDSTILSGSSAKHIEWYDALNNGNLLHVGDSFKVNVTSADTFYVKASDDYSSKVGEFNPYLVNPFTELRSFNNGIKFDVLRPLTIDSLTVHPTDSGTLVLTIRDKDNQLVGTKTYTVVPQGGSKIAVGITVPPGVDYRMSAAGSAFGKTAGQYGLECNRSSRYPFYDRDTSMIITGDLIGNSRFGYYYFFYDVEISVQGCDAGFGIIPVDVRPTPPLNLGNDTGYCTGTTINMVANATSTGAGSYKWDNNSTSATRSITTRGIYSVTVTGTNGCVISDTIKVDEIPQPTMSWVARRYCDNEGNVRLFSGYKLGGTYTGTGIVNGTHFNTGVGSGTYTLNYTYSDGMGCFGQTSGSVVVVQAPTATLGSIADVCQSNAPINLSNGTPTPGYFYDDEGLVGSGTYTPKNAGLDTVFYVGYAPNSCKDTASATINVKPAPQPTLTAKDTVCENETAITLSGVPTGGTYSGVGVTGPSFDPSVPGAGKHPIYYEAWFANGCTTKVGKLVTILEKPNVVFGPLLDVCEKTGLYSIVRGTPFGGTLSGNFVDDVNSTFDVDAAGVGTHPISYTIQGNNGCSNESTKNLIVKPAPVLNLGGDQQICGTNTLKLDAGNPGAAYFWNTNATTRTIIVARNGKYSVYVDLKGCVAEDSIEVSYEAVCVGLEELTTVAGVRVFPNPSNAILNVSFDAQVIHDNKEIIIRDALGKAVFETTTENEDGLSVDVSNYESGLYFIYLTIDNTTYQSKFSVIH